MEGADTWAFDAGTSLHYMFGLSGDADGTADLSNISGVNGTFTEGFSFTYNGGNSYIDRLVPTDGYTILNSKALSSLVELPTAFKLIAESVSARLALEVSDLILLVIVS